MGKHSIAQLRAEALGGDGRHILTDQGAAKPHCDDAQHHAAHSYYITAVAGKGAFIDYLGHQQRQIQLQDSFHQLEKWPQRTLDPIRLEIFTKLSNRHAAASDIPKFHPCLKLRNGTFFLSHSLLLIIRRIIVVSSLFQFSHCLC